MYVFQDKRPSSSDLGEGHDAAAGFDLAASTPSLKTRSNAGLIKLPLVPESECEWNRINLVGLPPSRLIAFEVELAVVEATERNGELVADFHADGSGLGKAQMVRIGRHTTAHKARLAWDKLSMLLVAQPDAFLEDRPAFAV